MSASTEPARSSSRRTTLLAIGISLLVIGVALSYFTLTRRWGYYAGPPFAPNEFTSKDRAALTVWWLGQNNFFCGPFPAIWPAVVVLCATPLIVAAIRRRAASPLWSGYGLLAAVLGAITVLVTMWTFVEFSQLWDSGLIYAADTGTLTLALGGYALLFLAILAFRQASRSSARPAP